MTLFPICEERKLKVNVSIWGANVLSHHILNLIASVCKEADHRGSILRSRSGIPPGSAVSIYFSKSHKYRRYLPSFPTVTLRLALKQYVRKEFHTPCSVANWSDSLTTCAVDKVRALLRNCKNPFDRNNYWRKIWQSHNKLCVNVVLSNSGSCSDEIYLWRSF